MTDISNYNKRAIEVLLNGFKSKFPQYSTLTEQEFVDKLDLHDYLNDLSLFYNKLQQIKNEKD